MANELKSHSAIKDRLENVSHSVSPDPQANALKWEETQDTMKLTLMRNLYGVSLPLQIMMERKIVTKAGKRRLWFDPADLAICRMPTCPLCPKVIST